MFENTQNAILTMVILLVPMYLILSGKDSFLLAFVCFVVGLNVFDISIGVNLPAARYAGFLLLPQTLVNLDSIIRSKTAQAVVAKYALLALMGVFFGFLFPWEDDRIRLFSQLPQGRTIIFLIRSLADISLTFFVARQVIRRRDPLAILHYIVIGTSVSAIVGILEFVTRIDFYQIITGVTILDKPFETSSRIRGLSYEPKGFGLMNTYGLLFSLILLSLKKSRSWLMLVILHATGFLLASSTSAFVAFGSGILTLGFYYKRARQSLIMLSLVAGLVMGCFFIYGVDVTDNFFEAMETRLSGKRFDEPQNLLESIAFRMEIFDSSALFFLADNPIYLLSGTGPGLISIPATSYMPQSGAYSWIVDTGLNCQPTTGLLSEISNTGVIGLLFWFIICFYSFLAFNSLIRHYPDEKEKWMATRAAFVVGMAIFAIQTSPLSAITPVLMGLGVGADCLAQVDRSRHRQTSMQLDHFAPSPADSV